MHTHVPVLLLESVSSEGEDLDEAHSDVHARVRTVAARRLHHRFEPLSVRLYVRVEV